MKLFRFYSMVITILAGVGMFVFFSGGVAEAVTAPQYQQMENIPGFEGKSKTFPEYVVAIYNLGLWIIGISAMFMLSVGGFMYLISAGNTAAAGSAKSTIKDALIGLVLGLSAWLIVHTINPDLTLMSIGSLSTGAGPSATTGGGATTPVAGQYTNAEAVAALQAAGISVTSTGNCSDQTNPQCTSLDGIPKSLIDKLIAVKADCGCTFHVTGGTEVGHATHGPGLSAVDISHPSVALRDSFIKNGALAYNGRSGTFCENASGGDVPDCGASADHIHVRFP
jgi:hypothetical protein